MTKRIAICLRGAISKTERTFYQEGALYLPGTYVNYRAVYNAIQRHIIAYNPDCQFDFFIHCWNPDLQTSLTDLYTPKFSVFEDNGKYNQEIVAKITTPTHFSSASHSLSIKKSLQLALDWQQEQGFVYNQIILYRPDVILLKNMLMDKYDPDKIYHNRSSPQGDFHFVMSAQNAEQFKLLYDYIDKGNPCKPHFWINNYVANFMHQPLLADDIVAGYDQEVLRKINVTMVKAGISLERLLEYGLTMQEIATYNVH